MTELQPVYEKKTDDIDELARSIRLALIVGSPSARHVFELSSDKAKDLARIIERRDQVRVVKVKEEVHPGWFLCLIGTVLMTTLVGDAALFLAQVLR